MGHWDGLIKSVQSQRYLFSRQVLGIQELSQLLFFDVRHSTLKVSVCTTVKDRFEHLEQTFLNNLKNNQNYPQYEFLLLNYNCPDPRTERWAREKLKPYIDLGLVNYYFYPDKPGYEMAHSRNLAFRLAQGDVICNVDADNFIGSNFLAYVAMVLSSGNYFLRGPIDGRGLAGRICMRREHWEAIGGYDERFKDWGDDDSDLADRLRLLGLEQKTIMPERFCRTILHSNELRVKYLSQDRASSLKQQRAIRQENAAKGILNPNGTSFGHGRVQKNFGEWITV